MKKQIKITLDDCLACPHCRDQCICTWDHDTDIPEHIQDYGGFPDWCPLEDGE